MDTQNKYSLWIVPQGETGQEIQQFVDTLAEKHHAPRFVPHLTLVANILLNSDEEYQQATAKAAELAASIKPFDIAFSDFGYTDEEFRCLFIKAKPSDELNTAYQTATSFFPQVADEHFRTMPHMSVLYGNYTAASKEAIIADSQASKLAQAAFRVDSFDFYLTNSPTESWKLDQQFKLRR